MFFHKENKSTADRNCWFQVLQLTHGVFQVVLDSPRQAVFGLNIEILTEHTPGLQFGMRIEY